MTLYLLGAEFALRRLAHRLQWIAHRLWAAQPMGYDDHGRLVPFAEGLHSTTEHRLMLAQVRAWAEIRYEDAT